MTLSARWYQIKAGPVLDEDRANEIARRVTQAGVAVGVSVNSHGTVEHSRVVSEPLSPATATRRAVALADLHPKQEAVGSGQVRLMFGVFGSQQEAVSLMTRIRARGYSASLVAEAGTAYYTTILIPFEKAAVEKSLAIIKSVGTDVPVEVAPAQ